MATCANNLLIVSGPVDPSMNAILGTYEAYSTDSFSGETFTRWILNGNTDYRIRLTFIGGGPDAGKYRWVIDAPIGPPFPISQYATSAINLNEVPACPISSNVNWITSSAPAPAPTVSAGGGGSPLSPQQRRRIYLRKQIKLGNKRGATLK